MTKKVLKNRLVDRVVVVRSPSQSVAGTSQLFTVVIDKTDL
jgi:hypothetical protein